MKNTHTKNRYAPVDRPRRFHWSRQSIAEGKIIVWKISRKVGPTRFDATVAVGIYEINMIGTRLIPAQRLRDARNDLMEIGGENGKTPDAANCSG